MIKAKTLFAIVLAFVACGSPGWAAETARTNDEEQIRQIERAWLDAIVKRDAAYLEKLQTPDFTMTGPDGRTLNKEASIKDTISGTTVIDDIKIDHLQVRFHDETAIATGLGTVKAHDKNEPIAGQYAWTDVFVKLNGEWKAVAAHVTAVMSEKE